ncbi:MAG: GNAT family N-acetyltransferase [Chloroflexota bacterium]|nr:GNAT family N-acetyltransferase [Chloroflexota bacterium]
MPELATKIEESKTPVPGTGHQGQTFLVGDEIYIRAIEPADSAYGQSWTRTILPRSTERYETWIKEEMAKVKRQATYIILRKRDDVAVGSFTTRRWDPVTQVMPWVDPLYGERGRQWLAQALEMAIPWLVDEQQRPIAKIHIAADQPEAIARLGAIGARPEVRFREMLRTWGGRTDLLLFEYLNRQWVDRLGDPRDTPLERSGTGEPRPVPAPVTLDGDPPANAVKVGRRVYLRPIEKKDAAQIAYWSRQETETFWDAGRWMYSTHGFAAHETDRQKKDPQTSVHFAVCLRANDELIGTLGLDDIDYVHGFAETGSAIARPEYRGSGYGSEAKHLLFDYAFNTLNLHALQSFVIFPNTRSAAALRKQGYREAGRLHWDFASFGKFENFICFDLLASDWRQMPRADFPAAEEEPRS